MRVSAKVDYALRAMAELAAAPPGVTTAEQLASAQQIPPKFLESISHARQEEAMEVAGRVAVFDRGRLEQIGAPAELYDTPASEFVLRFVGDAVRLGSRLVRPHEIVLRRWPSDDAVEVEIERIAVLGADVRVDLADGDGERLAARLRRDELDDLDLERGEIVWATAEASARDAEAGQTLG